MAITLLKYLLKSTLIVISLYFFGVLLYILIVLEVPETNILLWDVEGRGCFITSILMGAFLLYVFNDIAETIEENKAEIAKAIDPDELLESVKAYRK